MTPIDEFVDPADKKRVLRRSSAQTRNMLFEQQIDADLLLAGYAEDLLAQFGHGIYAAYLPIRSELSPLALITRLADLGTRTAMPITPAPGNPLDFRLWTMGDSLDDGPYDTKQPPANAPVCLPDIILTPTLAFDSSCWRLGYGGGFYDRSIASLRQAGRKVVAIGIAFSGQQVESVPTSPHDVVLDAILTPEDFILGLS